MNSIAKVDAEMEDKIRHACLKADELIEREISGVKQKWDYVLPKLKIMWTFTQVSHWLYSTGSTALNFSCSDFRRLLANSYCS